jgi:hypothetical protein
MSSSKKSNLVFLLILLAYAVYAAIFIFRSSFVVGNERYFVLFDDAMISMRYAKNLVDGYGLVWNVGEERVEGYSNPLWVVWMAALHIAPVDDSKISLLVQTSGALFIILSLFFVRKIALDLSGSELVGLLSVVLTAFYQPLNNWALLGMEVSLLVLLVCASVYWLLRILRQGRFSVWPYILLGIGMLVRVDMAVPYLIGLIFMVFADTSNRRKHLVWGLGLFILSLGGQTLFRLVYYGDILPNTYYLKVTGYPVHLRIARGLYALFTFVWDSNWLLCLLPLTLLFFRRNRQVLILFALVLGQVAYSVYVGGDAWEHRGGSNRYIAVIIPLFFILFTYAAYMLIQSLFNRLKAKPEGTRMWGNLVLVIFVVIAMISFNFLQGNIKSLERWLLLRQPMFTVGSNYYVQIARDIEKITHPEARIAVVAAGTVPYFTERPAIDMLGKNDSWIAQLPAFVNSSFTDLEKFRPGHMKWDYDYSIGELKPDIVVELWGESKPAQKYILVDYVVGGAGGEYYFSLRKDSPNIRWDIVELCTGECLDKPSD